MKLRYTGRMLAYSMAFAMLFGAGVVTNAAESVPAGTNTDQSVEWEAEEPEVFGWELEYSQGLRQ